MDPKKYYKLYEHKGSHSFNKKGRAPLRTQSVKEP
jgi:hypothetical protein